MKAMRTMKLIGVSSVIVVICVLVSSAVAEQTASGSDNTSNAQRAPLWGRPATFHGAALRS